MSETHGAAGGTAVSPHPQHSAHTPPHERQHEPQHDPPCAEPTYAGYLRLPQLLALQVPSAAGVHDERLFITVHQVQELWFAQLLAELAETRDRLLDGDPWSGRAGLARSLSIGHALVAGLRPLRTMRSAEFHAFRAALGTASGAQSAQFYEIETLSGAEWARGDRVPRGLSGTERGRLLRRRTEPSLWDGFLSLLGKAGFDAASEEGRARAYAQLAARRSDDTPSGVLDLMELAEGLLRFDEIWAEWRAGHVLMVERQIGAVPGTGGSAGMSHLRSRMHRRFFPELWHSVATGPGPV
jgi:tryptophan 2,3-dioxygenase